MKEMKETQIENAKHILLRAAGITLREYHGGAAAKGVCGGCGGWNKWKLTATIWFFPGLPRNSHFPCRNSQLLK